MKHQYDVTIVGGGMVGATLALALAQQTTFSIALLDHTSSDQRILWDEARYDHRVSALSLHSQQLFQALGVWKYIVSRRASFFHTIEVWDAKNGASLEFDSAVMNEPALGVIVENNLICAALYEKIKQYSQITCYTTQTLTAIHAQDDAAMLTIVEAENESIIRTTLLVGADGTHSSVRQILNIPVLKKDYMQHALVAIVQTTLPHHGIARQIFDGEHIIGLLPLNDLSRTESALDENASCLAALIWSLPSEQAKYMQGLTFLAFNRELSRVLQCASHACGEIQKTISERHLFPLSQQQARHYVQTRVVLIGDAAHTMHPLAGQGVNVGLLDVAALVELFSQHQHDFSRMTILRKYERWRKAENFTMLFSVHGLKQLFGNTKPCIQKSRGLGMNVLNKISGLKALLMRYAVGDRMKKCNWISME